MVASLDPRWLQGAFSTLVVLFDRVVVRNNVGKTVDMVCRPFQAAGTQSEAAYRRQMTGEGPSYWEQQKERVQFRDCGGGDGGGIIDGSQDETAWASGRGETELENLVHGGRAADIIHGLPVQGRPADLPGGGMPRTSGDQDGDAGTFSAPACPGYRGHFGGGKHPPPTVPPMQHAGPLAYTERKAPCHRTLRQGSRA